MNRRRLVLVVSVLVVAAVATSVSLAAIGGGGTIKTCFKTSTSTWRPIDSNTSCKPGETGLDFYSKSGADAAFVQGRSGQDYRFVTGSGSLADGLNTPFGEMRTACFVGEARYFFRRTSGAGGGTTI